MATTKVPIYDNLRVDDKAEVAIRLFSVNVNGMSFWLRNNYRAEILKYVFRQYGIDLAGFHVCINWSAFKPSQTLASLLCGGAEPIRSVASHSKRETRNIGRRQRGGTATILRDQLAAFVKDSDVYHT